MKIEDCKRLTELVIDNGKLFDRLSKGVGIDKAIDRLAAYENTGLTPKEVQLISNVLQEVGVTYNCHFNFVVKVLKEYAESEGAKNED